MVRKLEVFILSDIWSSKSYWPVSLFFLVTVLIDPFYVSRVVALSVLIYALCPSKSALDRLVKRILLKSMFVGRLLGVLSAFAITYVRSV